MGRKAYDGRVAETFIRWKNVVFFTRVVGAHSVQRAAWDSDITYSHALALLEEWEKMELLLHSKKGRTNVYVYTKKGEDIDIVCRQLLALGESR